MAERCAILSSCDFHTIAVSGGKVRRRLIVSLSHVSMTLARKVSSPFLTVS